MIKEAIVKIVNKGDLTYEEAYTVMNEIMSGETSPTQNAAFLAAGDGKAVGMGHLLTALGRELRKSGKVLSREDFGQYYMLAEEDDNGPF